MLCSFTYLENLINFQALLFSDNIYNIEGKSSTQNTKIERFLQNFFPIDIIRWEWKRPMFWPWIFLSVI